MGLLCLALISVRALPGSFTVVLPGQLQLVGNAAS
jgi:hypothetical protein